MVTQKLVSGMAAILVTFAGAQAFAVAMHHSITKAPIKDASGNVVGVKLRMMVRPEGYSTFRIGLGANRMLTPQELAGKSLRKLGAGIQPGYLVKLLDLREVTGQGPNDLGPQQNTFKVTYPTAQAQPNNWQARNTHEVEVEATVMYDGNQLKTGAKLDLVGTFANGHGPTDEPHNIGMRHSPTSAFSQDYEIELP